MQDITISLISYNQKHHLERLLPTLMPAAHCAGARVLLTANRCTDGTVDWLRSEYPEIDVIENPNVSGYGENHNLNLARADSRYFVIMNSDMEITAPDTFVQLRDYLDAHPDIGLVIPRVLNEDGTIQGLNKRFPSVFDLLLRFLGRRAQRGSFQRRLERYEMRDVGYERECDVEFVSGAFMFARTELLKSLDGFDTRYFMYFEDVDLCRRVQKTHRTAYVPDVSVIHFWERATRMSSTHRKFFVSSAFRYFSTWGYKLW